MSNTKTAIVVSFVLGAILAFFAAYLLLRPSLPSVQALRCEVPPNEFLKISGFEVKILDANVKSPRPRKGDDPRPRMARLQWRCDVQNISTVAVRYGLKTELLDKDAFVLATGDVDGQYGQGDLAPSQTHTVHEDVSMEYARARAIASSRVTPKALKTNAQMEQEREEQRLQQWRTAQAAQAEQQRRLAAAQEERQSRVDAVRKVWKDLRQGMTKADVQSLLGKPLSIRSFGSAGDWWEYPPIEGTFTHPKVNFSQAGQVTGWTAP